MNTPETPELVSLLAEERGTLHKKIKDAIKAFRDETGLIVTKITVETMHSSSSNTEYQNIFIETRA